MWQSILEIVLSKPLLGRLLEGVDFTCVSRASSSAELSGSPTGYENEVKVSSLAEVSVSSASSWSTVGGKGSFGEPPVHTGFGHHALPHHMTMTGDPSLPRMVYLLFLHSLMPGDDAVAEESSQDPFYGTVHILRNEYWTPTRAHQPVQRFSGAGTSLTLK